MKFWRIHLAWICVAMLAAALGRWSAGRRESGVAPEERGLKPAVTRVEKTSGAGASPGEPAHSPAPLQSPEQIPAQWLALSEGAVSLDQIRQGLKSDDYSSQWRAVRAIEQIRDPKIRRELLLEQLKCTEPQMRWGALHKLRRLIGDEATGILQEHLRSDPSADLRVHAAALLGEPGGEGNIELLLKSFREDEFRVQVAAAKSLNFLGQPGPMTEVIPRLAAGLESPDGAVRKEAAGQLAAFLSPVTIPHLTRALRDSNGDVRAGAARGLGELAETGHPEVIPLLESVVQDPVADVAETARAYLKRLKEAAGK
ncbi:MAG: HEAT repeat domain-containing protein [Planctomycetes bacterium]|nr:HEAT repeat domain-containing protein [Planctomycetota bacterium]